MSDNSTDSIPIAPSPCAKARPILAVAGSPALHLRTRTRL